MRHKTERLELRGKRAGKLYALRDVGSSRLGRLWYCLCSCGGRTVITAASFGKIQSCGCARKEAASRLGREYGGVFLRRKWGSSDGTMGLGLDRHLSDHHGLSASEEI
jgi:hypothetical protein